MCHNCECCLCVYMKRQCWLLFLCYTDTSICAARVCEASIVVPTFLPLKPEKVKITPVMPTVIHYICASQWAHQSHHMSLITISALHNFTHTHAPRAHMHTHTRAHTHTNQVSDFYHICLHCTPRACVCLIHKHTDVAMCVCVCVVCTFLALCSNMTSALMDSCTVKSGRSALPLTG